MSRPLATGSVGRPGRSNDFRNSTPRSGCPNCLPISITTNFTVSPLSRNFSTCLILVDISWSDIFRRNLICFMRFSFKFSGATYLLSFRYPKEIRFSLVLGSPNLKRSSIQGVSRPKRASSEDGTSLSRLDFVVN
jgi:hypothetical protein